MKGSEMKTTIWKKSKW